MSVSSADVVRIVDAYTTMSATVRARVLAFVEATWRGLPDYRDADINRFIAAIVPVVEAGQRQVASLTDAYLASVARQVLGAGAPVGISRTDVTGLRNGVTPTEVYNRAGVTVWTALHNGVPLHEATERGLARALDMAATDIQLAKRQAARSVMSADNRIVGYRRVLEGARNCGLCIVASTQRYHKADLLPIHPACDCGVLPIYGRHDIGQIIDTQSLEGVHQAIQDRFGVSNRGARGPIDYRKVLVTREHGELGPVLTVKGQNFTGPNDLAA